MPTLTDKTVIVTGASRGIGAATARLLGAQGARVALAARSGDAIAAIAAEIVEAGGNAVAIQCDVAHQDQVAALVTRTADSFGRIDVLVNNASVIEPIARLADSDPSVWSDVVDINFKSVYYAMHAVIPHMTGAGGGTVINISSGAAVSALEGWSHYCATKAAVLSLTRCADKEYRDQGLRVIGLSPGTVATEMQIAIRASGINPVSQLEPSAHIPPDWVAQTIAYLAGPGGDAHLGTDFSLKTDAGRAEVGLPATSSA